MKTTKSTWILAGLLFAMLALSCASSGGGAAAEGGERGGFPGAWAWGTFTDAASQGSSRISMIEDVENVDGEVYMTYALSGEITNQYEYGYAGWYAIPDDPTLEKLITAKNVSFRVLGDGQLYTFMLCTSDIEDAAYYRSDFRTKKDEPITVTIKVGGLAQPEYWGAKKRFSQDLATQVQWQTTNNGKPGTFNLKIWDLRVHD